MHPGTMPHPPGMDTGCTHHPNPPRGPCLPRAATLNTSFSRLVSLALAPASLHPRAEFSAMPSSNGIPVTRELTNAFLQLKTTQERIRQVAVSRLGGEEAPPDWVDEVVQITNEKAFRTTRLAESPEHLRPWVSAIAAHAAIDFLRRQGVHEARFGTGVDVEQLPPDPLYAPDGDAGDPEDDRVEWRDQAPNAKDDPAMVSPWVDGAVEKRKGNKERDRAMVEMIRFKANHPGMTDAQVAATFGMTPEAYESRLRRFRAYYVPLRQRHVKRRRTILLLVLFGALVVALLAWLLWPRARPLLDISRDPSTTPVPSATTSVTPEKLDQALPPEDNRK